MSEFKSTCSPGVLPLWVWDPPAGQEDMEHSVRDAVCSWRACFSAEHRSHLN